MRRAVPRRRPRRCCSTPPEGVPEGAVVLPLDEAVGGEDGEVVERYFAKIVGTGEIDPFVARNEAEWTGGVFVYVLAGVRVSGPIPVTATVAAGQALNWGTMIAVEDGGEAEVCE